MVAARCWPGLDHHLCDDHLLDVAWDLLNKAGRPVAASLIRPSWLLAGLVPCRLVA